MSKQDIIRKLTSRKLWLAVAAFVSAVLTALGHEKVAVTVSGLIMQGAVVIAYLVSEGLVDAANKPPDAGEAEDDKEHPSISFWKTKDSEEDEACNECDITPYLNEDGEEK